MTYFVFAIHLRSSMILEEQMQVPEVRGDVIIARYLLPEVFQCQTLALKIGLYSFYPLKLIVQCRGDKLGQPRHETYFNTLKRYLTNACKRFMLN